jgi:HK97 family phage portal protein
MKILDLFKKKGLTPEFHNVDNRKYNFTQLLGLGGSSTDRSIEAHVEDGYIKNTDVKPVVDKIANTVSSVEWKVYRGDNEEVTGTPLNDLLVRPNEHESWNDFMFASTVQLLTTGNVFQKGTEAIGFEGEFRQLEVLHTQSMQAITSTTGDLLGWEYTKNKYRYKYDLDQLIHTMYYNPSLSACEHYLGLSPLESAQDAYVTSINQWKASSNLLENKGIQGFITNESDEILTEDELDQAQRAFDRKTRGADNFGKSLVTPTKMRYESMGMTANELKLIEIGVITLRAICNAYGVDSSLFNDPSNKTFNNRKEAVKAFWSDCIIPILKKFRDKYNHSLVNTYNLKYNTDYYIDFDISEVTALHEDKDKEADRIVKLISAGIITPEQGALMLGIEIDNNEQ